MNPIHGRQHSSRGLQFLSQLQAGRRVPPSCPSCGLPGSCKKECRSHQMDPSLVWSDPVKTFCGRITPHSLRVFFPTLSVLFAGCSVGHTMNEAKASGKAVGVFSLLKMEQGAGPVRPTHPEGLAPCSRWALTGIGELMVLSSVFFRPIGTDWHLAAERRK